jgi:hypothetical protein
VTVPANSIVINPNFYGEFGFDIQFMFTAEQLANAGINGNNIRLYHANHNGAVTEKERLRLNSDGSVNFTIGHASFYILSEETPIGSAAESNPHTGTVIGFTAVTFAGIVLIASRRRKNYNKDIRM